MSAKVTAKRVAKTAGQSAAQGAGYAATAASALPNPLQLSKRSNIFLMIVGWSLLLILVYLVTAKKPIVDAIGALGSLGGSAATAWVAPIDPLTVLGAGSGSVPSSSSSPAGGAEAGTPAVQPGEHAPAAPPPAPSKVKVHANPNANTAWDRLRAMREREGVLAKRRPVPRVNRRPAHA